LIPFLFLFLCFIAAPPYHISYKERKKKEVEVKEEAITKLIKN
jgi:hypothetical protein